MQDFALSDEDDNMQDFSSSCSFVSSINLSSDVDSLTTDSELLVPFSDRKEDRVELDMGNGIKLWTTLHYSSNLRRFTTIKWNMSDRNENQFKNLFNNEKKFSSDIFKIISRKNREGQESKTLFNFPFSQAMSNSSMFRVPVDGKNMSANFTTDAKFVVAYSVGVGKDSNWKEAEAKLEVFIFGITKVCLRF